MVKQEGGIRVRGCDRRVLRLVTWMYGLRCSHVVSLVGIGVITNQLFRLSLANRVVTAVTALYFSKEE